MFIIAIIVAAAVAIAVAVPFAVAPDIAFAVAVAVAIAVAVAVAVAVAIAIAAAVAVTVAITNASSFRCLHFTSSAGPLIASTSCQPPVVSWRLLSFAGRLIGTLSRYPRSLIGNCHHLTVILFIATSAGCQ